MTTPDVHPVHRVEQKHASNEPQIGSRAWQDEVIQQTWNGPNALAKKLEDCTVKYNSPQGASELLRAADERHHDSAAWVDQMHRAADKVDRNLWEDLAIGHVKKTGFFQDEQNSALLRRTELENSQLDTIGRDPTMRNYLYDHAGGWNNFWTNRGPHSNISEDDIDARYQDIRSANQTARQNDVEQEYAQHLHRILNQQVVVGASRKTVRQLITDQSIGTMSAEAGASGLAFEVERLIRSGYLTPGQKAALEPLANDPDKAARYLSGT